MKFYLLKNAHDQNHLLMALEAQKIKEAGLDFVAKPFLDKCIFILAVLLFNSLRRKIQRSFQALQSTSNLNNMYVVNAWPEFTFVWRTVTYKVVNFILLRNLSPKFLFRFLIKNFRFLKKSAFIIVQA